MPNQMLHADRSRILFSRDTSPLQPPRQVNLCVRHQELMVVEVLRYSMVTLIAAAMSVVGWQLMAHFPAVWEFDRVSFGLILPSILLWAFLIPAVRRTTGVGAMTIGLLSPLLGGFLLGGPSGVGVVLSAWPAAFVTGGVTGLLMHRCLFWNGAGK